MYHDRANMLNIALPIQFMRNVLQAIAGVLYKSHSCSNRIVVFGLRVIL